MQSAQATGSSYDPIVLLRHRPTIRNVLLLCADASSYVDPGKSRRAMGERALKCLARILKFPAQTRNTISDRSLLLKGAIHVENISSISIVAGTNLGEYLPACQM